jgi:DNA ligase-associated metallophosphoesterase
MTWQFHHEGALYLSDTATLVVSDLHLEKGSAYAGRGQLLPPYDSIRTLARLEALIAATGAQRLIALGDSFEDNDGFHRLSDPARAKLDELRRSCHWIWITGNHDTKLSTDSVDNIYSSFAEAPLIFRHIADMDVPDGYFEVSGHFHPKATTKARGRRITRPCFIHDDKRLIMPAFGAFTGGLDINDPAIQHMLDDEQHITICGRTRTHHQTRIREAS